MKLDPSFQNIMTQCLADISNAIEHCMTQTEDTTNRIQEIDNILSSNPYAQVPYLVHENNQLLKNNLALISKQNDLIEFYNQLLKFMNSPDFTSFSKKNINQEQQLIIDHVISFYEKIEEKNDSSLYQYLKSLKNTM